MKVTDANFQTITRLFTFYQRKYFFAYGQRLNISVFVSKVQNEQGILLFVHRNLAWESFVLGAHLGSLCKILVAQG